MLIVGRFYGCSRRTVVGEAPWASLIPRRFRLWSISSRASYVRTVPLQTTLYSSEGMVRHLNISHLALAPNPRFLRAGQILASAPKDVLAKPSQNSPSPPLEVRIAFEVSPLSTDSMTSGMPSESDTGRIATIILCPCSPTRLRAHDWRAVHAALPYLHILRVTCRVSSVPCQALYHSLKESVASRLQEGGIAIEYIATGACVYRHLVALLVEAADGAGTDGGFDDSEVRLASMTTPPYLEYSAHLVRVV